MQQIVREQNQTLVMVTHDNYLASYADRRIRIIDGKIISIEEGAARVEEEEEMPSQAQDEQSKTDKSQKQSPETESHHKKYIKTDRNKTEDIMTEGREDKGK